MQKYMQFKQEWIYHEWILLECKEGLAGTEVGAGLWKFWAIKLTMMTSLGFPLQPILCTRFPHFHRTVLIRKFLIIRTKYYVKSENSPQQTTEWTVPCSQFLKEDVFLLHPVPSPHLASLFITVAMLCGSSAPTSSPIPDSMSITDIVLLLSF